MSVITTFIYVTVWSIYNIFIILFSHKHVYFDVQRNKEKNRFSGQKANNQ